MSKKYLSLDEAARMLSIQPEELVRLREKGDVRGFADRGTWKFKHEDVETLLRRRQADSNPEVPLMGGADFDPFPAPPRTPAKQDVGEQPTVIRRDRGEENLLAGDSGKSNSPSDSDVRLVGGKDFDLDYDSGSDSDVKLVGLGGGTINTAGTDPEIVIKKPGNDIKKPGSDSDVRLVRSDSDSDVKLVDSKGSDSDVKLVDGATAVDFLLLDDEDHGTDHDINMPPVKQQHSDSDIKLIPEAGSLDLGEVSLMDDDDDAVAINFSPNRNQQSSVLDDESGISLGRDSSLLLGESGISLAGPSDSGIALELNDDDAELTLALDDDSGISLDAGESGISLDSGDSGISLESAESGISLSNDNRGGTVPMMDIFADDDDSSPTTQFDVQAMDDDDFGATGVMDTTGDDVFNLDDDGQYEEHDDGVEAYGEEEMDLDDAAYDGEEDLDVFEPDEGEFGEAGVESYGAAPVGRIRATETEWDTPTFVGLTIGSLLLVVCGLVMVDLVKNTASASTPNVVTGQVIELIGGLYK